MFNTVFFRKMNFNYIKSQLNELIKKKINNDEFFKIFLKSSSKRIFN